MSIVTTITREQYADICDVIDRAKADACEDTNVYADEILSALDLEAEPEFTNCGGGRDAMLSGCRCDACLCAGDDEYHRRRDERW